MINKLKNIFPHLQEKECLKIVTHKLFDILDDKVGEKAYIINNNGQFNVLNKNEKAISFLSVDDCLYNSADGKRCDCIIYNNEVFCFIELKHCKDINIKRHRRKAKKQLIATIEFFTSNFQLPKKLEAYICVTCVNNEENITMIPLASNGAAQLEFEDEYNTQLFYECKKEFF